MVGVALDRLGLVVVGVVDLLAVDLHGAVLVAPHARRAEVLLRALVVAVVALATPERHVLRLVVGPVLEVLRRVVLELLDLLVGLLPGVLVLGLALGAVLLLLVFLLLLLFIGHVLSHTRVYAVVHGGLPGR